MPGPLTHVAVALLARDRLAQIRDALLAKKANGTAREIELQVLYMAQKAHSIMSAAQPRIEPPLRLYGPPLTDGVSRFVMLGAVGPDLPRYAAMYAPGQEWLWDTLHKGNPDEHRERVLARSTDFVFTFWRKVEPLIDADTSKADERTEARDKVRAYLLGHLCHVAADVLSHPWYDDVAAHPGDAGRPRLRRADVAGAVERAVAARFFNRGPGADTRGSDWATWWPSTGDVPGAFYGAFDAAVREVYGGEGRPAGLKAFEDAFRAYDPPAPALSPRLVRDGVATFRTVAETGHGWDLWDWLGVTAPTFLLAFGAYPLAAVLTRASDFETELTGTPDEIAEKERVRTYELVAYPFAATALTPLVTMIWVTASSFGVGSQIVTGWVAAGVQLLAAVGFFATLGGAGDARWALFFVVPLFVEVAHMLHVLIRGGRGDRHWQLALGTLLHLALALVFMLCYRTFLHPGIAELKKREEDRDYGVFVGWMALWFGMVVVLWIVHALFWRYVFGAKQPSDADNAFAGRHHHLRLYDDAALGRDPLGPSPALDGLLYPSGARPLLKLWWRGPDAQELSVRSDRDRLTFSFDGAGAGPKQTVHLPVASTTLREFAQLLTRTVRDKNGASTQFLHVEPAFPADPEMELPPGLAFSDWGDHRDTQADHDTDAAAFRTIPRTEADALPLSHAPRELLSTRFGKGGPVAEERRAADEPSVAGSTITRDPANARRIVATAGSFLTRLFRPGDVIERLPAPGDARVVVAVESDLALLVSTPFSPALPAAGATYRRRGDDRSQDRTVAGWTVADGPGAFDLTGGGGALFGSLFRPGDTIRVNPPAPAAPQERRIAVVVSDTVLTLEESLDPRLGAGVTAPFDRVADETADGFAYLADADDNLFSGDTVMGHAADLATLLCLGAASRLLPADQLAAGPAGVGTPHPLRKVYQVFRNWNLDRRRENEWRMLVVGGAVSEKRGDPAADDSAAPVEAGWSSLVGAPGERVANELGWTGLLRGWVDMARHPATDATADVAFRPGSPTNLELSRGLAFLLDMRDPGAP